MTRPPRGSGTEPAPRAANDGDDDLLSSASDARGSRAEARGAGKLALSGRNLDEAAARAILDRAFADAGLTVQHDFPFTGAGLLLALDGYDPVAKVGYQFVSHGDVDVVTDFDAAAEQAMRELDGVGKVRLLIVHDGDVADGAALAALANVFLAGLDRTNPGSDSV
jgi:hypothetical protein